jgi:hypothetical protein
VQHVNTIKDKNHIITKDEENTFVKIQKVLTKPGMKGT